MDRIVGIGICMTFSVITVWHFLRKCLDLIIKSFPIWKDQTQKSFFTHIKSIPISWRRQHNLVFWQRRIILQRSKFNIKNVKRLYYKFGLDNFIKFFKFIRTTAEKEKKIYKFTNNLFSGFQACQETWIRGAWR